MPRFAFQTISDDLSELADAIAAYFDGRGYRLAIEPIELGFPYTPAFLAKRQGTTVIVEVAIKIDRERILQWTNYSKTCSADMRIAFAIKDPALLTPESETLVRSSGVGCYLFSGGHISERTPPLDQAVAVHPPEFSTLPRRLQPLLGPAYDKLDQGNWHDAFEDMCRALEVEARERLKLASRRGVRFIKKGQYRTVPAAQIDRMTMGQLAVAYSEIETQNHADSRIRQALELVNKDRVGVVHHRQKPHVQRRLRRNAGNHMWAIVQTLKSLL